MAAHIIDGRAIARKLQKQTAQQVDAFVQRTGVRPALVAVLVGDDPASGVYVRNKQRACEKAGIDSRLVRPPTSSSTPQLLAAIDQLNHDPRVHGILVQLPLPEQIQAQQVLDRVDPLKDVDAFHPLNVGLISQGRPRFLPCTPHGVLHLLRHSGIKLFGRRAVVIGRSDIVGKPIAMMMAQRTSELGPDLANATVTLCHSRTPDLSAICRQADVLIAAIGKPNFITGEMIRPGAVVIDVGINRTDDGLVGDVHFPSASRVASHITPVPGGVGPMTVTMLLGNTLRAAQLQAATAETVQQT